MDENFLLKISLIFSLLGILAILYISETTTIDLSEISQLTKGDLDKKVRVNGIINSIGESPGLIIVNIEDENSKITIIAFKENSNTTLEKNQNVEVLGTLTEYNGELEIIADTIKAI